MWDTDTARHTIVAHPTQVGLYRLSSAWLAVPAFIEELFVPRAAHAPRRHHRRGRELLPGGAVVPGEEHARVPADLAPRDNAFVACDVF